MSRWGVFTITNSGARHVAPCDADGFSVPPHVLSDKCLCKPELQDGIWVHQDDDGDLATQAFASAKAP
jgi:hypothetical protein